jgi:hypothetical protein
LHMAMVGLRDCSIIATPPEGRSAYPDHGDSLCGGDHRACHSG